MNLVDKLSGYKTYIAAVLTALLAALAAVHGGATPIEAGLATLVSLAVAFARAGSKKDAVHAAALTVSGVAPLIAALIPAAASAAKVIGNAAADVAADVLAPPAPTVVEAPAAAIVDAVAKPTPELVEAVVSAVVARLSGAAPIAAG